MQTMSLKNVSELAAKIAPAVVDKVFMPAISIALTKHGDSDDQRKQLEANAAKLITDQMAVAIDLVIEASNTGNLTSGKALEAALKKFGATSSFWQSDIADCLVNVALLTATVGKTTTAAAAAPATMGASTVVVVSNAIQIYADYLQMQSSCKAPAARAQKVVDDQLESFAAQFYRGFMNWIAMQAGPDFSEF
jgi:hypothetical protein